MNRPEPISVSELNNYIKRLVDADEVLNNVYIKGELSNFKRHYSGHLYFTLKDENSLIKCVMFKSYTSNLNFMPKDGMSVVVLGSVAVFERDGVYQKMNQSHLQVTYVTNFEEWLTVIRLVLKQ